MDERCISKECLNDTGFSYTLSLINGKYKMTILYTLMEFGIVRFNEMKKYIGGVQPDGTREISDSDSGRNVRVGITKPNLKPSFSYHACTGQVNVRKE